MKFLKKLLLILPIAAVFLPMSAFGLVYTAELNGANESPPAASPGTGFATVDIDTMLHTLYVEVTFSGLIGNTVAAHIHSPTIVPGAGNAGVATQTPSFLNFPVGVTAGNYAQIFDLTKLSSFNLSFVNANGGTTASAEAALAASMVNGTAYFNIHTTAFPGGEIRGFLAQPIPEPATVLLLGIGLAALVLRSRKRKSGCF